MLFTYQMLSKVKVYYAQKKISDNFRFKKNLVIPYYRNGTMTWTLIFDDKLS